jgi:hypothetical protein
MDNCKALDKDYNPITKRCNVKCKKNQTRRAVDFKCVSLKNAQVNAKPNCDALGKELNPYTNRCNVKCKKNQLRRQSDFKCISSKALVTPVTPYITPEGTPYGTPVDSPIPPRALTRETAIEKIGRFTRRANDKFQKKKEVLDAACKDSSICLVLGSPVQGDIKSFFDHFINFRFLVNVKKIGKESANGFVHELKYTHRGYDAYAIIKSSQNNGADNLMYEYRVGQYINTQIKIFPCFLETYGLFSYTSEDNWKYNKNTDNIPIDQFKTNVETIDYDLGLACRKSKHIAVMIQHIKNATEIWEVMTKLHYTIYASNLLAILYQIYFPLSFMNFTHYDLHHENVMLYTPDPTKFIHYHYHHPDGHIVSFKSIYVAKLIDYGRCYFNDGVESANDVYTALCTTPSCNSVASKCGKNSGFNLFKTPVNDASNFFVQSSERNLSHDLRYLKIIKEHLITNALTKYPAKNARDRHIKSELSDFFKIPITYTSKYGTSSSASCAPNICNVSDVVIALEPRIRNILAQVDDLFFNGLTKLGDMHIYSDGRPFTYN